jgi:hypothetical protein
VLVSAYVPYRRREAEFADDLSALTVDIEHWQQKKYCSGLCFRAESYQLSSQFGDHAGRSGTLWIS